jgi:hypothetical protein
LNSYIDRNKIHRSGLCLVSSLMLESILSERIKDRFILVFSTLSVSNATKLHNGKPLDLAHYIANNVGHHNHPKNLISHLKKQNPEQ